MINYFIKLDDAVIDGENWVTVVVNSKQAAWFKTKDKLLWYEHKNPAQLLYRTVDLHESLYILGVLKWS